MTKLHRKSWSVRCLRWYQTLPRQIQLMKPGTQGWKKRINKWARRTVRGVKGDQIFRGMVSETHRHTRWGEDDSEQEVVYRMDVENRFNEQCRI